MKTLIPPRRLAAVAAAAAALVAASALTAPAATAAPAPGSFDLDLDGTWKFLLGGEDPAFVNDLSFADPDFDDSSWDDIVVPTESGEPFDTVDGFGWYRLDFDLPAEAEGTNLIASFGYLDDADEVFLNGVRIGGSGDLPPNQATSQWFEQRLYPIPADAPNFGGENTFAVRLYDMDGGGGWYKGPIGISSKDVVRDEVFGIQGAPASASETAAVLAVLDEQADAIADGDVNAFVDTLDAGYFHDGRDIDRRSRELNGWLDESDLVLRDGEVEVVKAADGTLIADTNRSISGLRDGKPFEFQPTAQEFLYFDGDSLLEVGNHSRFFRETVDSKIEGQPREFMTYLPPSYLTDPDREYPVVYLLHGINGGSREWEPREIDTVFDGLWAEDGLAETIVIMPDGESSWYVDNPALTPWRSMFLDEMMPLVDAEYRTLDDADFRGISGVSMGGFGAYSIGLNHPELFSSLASHIGALSMSRGGFDIPVDQIADMSTEDLSHYDFYYDACENDWYRFDDAVRALDVILDDKGIPHTSVVEPTGTHDDACWMPNLVDSFGVHSAHFRAAGLVEEDATVELDESEIAAGEELVVSGEGYTAGDRLRIELRPEAEDTGMVRAAFALAAPMTLGEVTVGADGTFSTSVRIPADLDAGTYALVIVGPAGDLASTPITVLAAEDDNGTPGGGGTPGDNGTPGGGGQGDNETTPGGGGQGGAGGDDPANVDGGDPDGELATTGADSTPLIVFGALLLMTGAGAFLLLRRRRTADADAD